jgi:hypothetical protein
MPTATLIAPNPDAEYGYELFATVRDEPFEYAGINVTGHLIECQVQGKLVVKAENPPNELVSVASIVTFDDTVTSITLMDQDIFEEWQKRLVTTFFIQKQICSNCGKFEQFSAIGNTIGDVRSETNKKLCKCCSQRGCGSCAHCMNPDASYTEDLKAAQELYKELMVV